MSTAMVVHERTPPAGIERQSDRALAGIAPMTFTEMVGMGEQLVRTGFLPAHVKTGAQAAAIILTGHELGMAPMRALRSLTMVQGKVVENADSQLARFKTDGGRAVWKRLDEQGATLWLRHPNSDEHEESFTWDDAVRAKLASKDTWKAYPKAMLRSRVITAGLKSIGWEGGVGAYDPDEAAAFAAPAPLSGQRPAAAAAQGQEAVVEEVVDDPMTIDTALAMPLPGGPTAWNGQGGTPLGQLAPRMIPAIRKWIDGKIAEMEATEGEAAPIHYRLQTACDAILSARRTDAPAQTETQAKTASAPREATIESLESRVARLTTLLANPKVSDAERADYTARAAGATSARVLDALIADVEDIVNSPV